MKAVEETTVMPMAKMDGSTGKMATEVTHFRVHSPHLNPIPRIVSAYRPVHNAFHPTDQPTMHNYGQRSKYAFAPYQSVCDAFWPLENMHQGSGPGPGPGPGGIGRCLVVAYSLLIRCLVVCMFCFRAKGLHDRLCTTQHQNERHMSMS